MKLMTFSIKLGEKTTIGGVTRYQFSVELPRAEVRTSVGKDKPATAVNLPKSKPAEE